MSGFLTRLIERQWGQMPTIQPRTRPTFALESDAAALQVVDDLAVLQPHANLQHQAGMQHAGSEAKLRQPESDIEPQHSPQRSVRRSVPLVNQTMAQPLVPPLLQSVTSAPASVDIERPASRPPAPLTLSDPLAIDSTPLVSALNTSGGAQPASRVGERAKKNGIADTQAEVSRADSALKPAPPLVALRVRDPNSIEQQISAPESLHLATPASNRSTQAEPRVAESPVHVTIGRIEVTAVTTPPAPKRVPSPRKASMPLQDYLARRRGGQP